MQKLAAVFTLHGILAVFGQTTSDCPSHWFEYKDHCYYFVIYPPKTYVQAKQICQDDGAGLVSVESADEHNYITTWLMKKDGARNTWFTSGIYVGENKFIWEVTGDYIAQSNNWNKNGKTTKGDNVVYRYSDVDGGYGWTRMNGRTNVGAYVCEIPKSESYRVIQEFRDNSYGTAYLKGSDSVPIGPQFLYKPHDTEILGTTTMVFLECIATGNPQPTYVWYKLRTSSRKTLTYSVDSRYTLTNGRLSIQNPTDAADTGQYQCRAQNRFGSILFSSIHLSFADLGTFSNVDYATVRPDEYSGAILECPPIQSNSKLDIVYQWKRGKEFIITAINPYIFVSHDGKLYFSEVYRGDNGGYRCMVTLRSPLKDRNYVGSSQVPSRISNVKNLEVIPQISKNAQVEIQDSFVQVFPRQPIAGQTIIIECFAYGTGPLRYSWSLPVKQDSRIKLTDHNRQLTITDVRLTDAGEYICTVRSIRTRTSDSKKFILLVEAKPYFTLPLKSQHLDKGKQLTWRCEAIARPLARYTWYKNGDVLKSGNDVTVSRNSILIKNLDAKKHDGMYQCAAVNAHGTTMSAAQLRVLEFAPSFVKNPLPASLIGAYSGSITIICSPEAAPFPEYTWLFNGKNLGLKEGDTTSRVRMLANGNLLITELKLSDKGTYTCQVKNPLGTARSSTKLEIVERTMVIQPPSNTTVMINNTAFISCLASHPTNIDLVYLWQFNGHTIDPKQDTRFRLYLNSENKINSKGGLYIQKAQFHNQGNYTCIAMTTVQSDGGSSYLTVDGPPGEPSGVREMEMPSPRSVRISWWDGANHGSAISHYLVEAKSNYSSAWLLYRANVYKASAVIGSGKGKLATTVENLSPGTAYQFRVKAINSYGIGTPSLPTTDIVISGAPPEKAPSYVGGGGGKVGELRIEWKPLSPRDWYGWGIGYIVEWRQRRTNIANRPEDWQSKRVSGNVHEYYHTVGIEYIYTEYEVRVTPFNSYGNGAASKTGYAFSAEGLPVGIPTKVRAKAFNSTAITVKWNPVPDNVQAMNGKLQGYKVNYWLRYGGEEIHATQAIFPGNITKVLIIGLEPNTWYMMNVLVYNSAGNGANSVRFPQQTYHRAPKHYPTNVFVHSRSSDSVLVTFRGVSTGVFEEPLTGYRIRYWTASETVKQAKKSDIDVEKRNYGVISGLKKDMLYKMRVYGYSRGGDGQMSSPEILFTLGGMIPYDPMETEIRAAASSPCCVWMVLLIVEVILLIL